LKCSLLNEELKVIYKNNINFDKELSHYKTHDGVNKINLEKNEYKVTTLLWIESLELILDKMKKDNIDFEKIFSIVNYF
jgi:xylulokinase